MIPIYSICLHYIILKYHYLDHLSLLLVVDMENNMEESDGEEDSMTARQRHITALENCIQTLKKAASSFDKIAAGELLAEDLNISSSFLEEITGQSCSDELLTEIFSRFCIGK